MRDRMQWRRGQLMTWVEHVPIDSVDGLCGSMQYDMMETERHCWIESEKRRLKSFVHVIQQQR
jgi:hypothetical protein